MGLAFDHPGLRWPSTSFAGYSLSELELVVNRIHTEKSMQLDCSIQAHGLMKRRCISDFFFQFPPGIIGGFLPHADLGTDCVPRQIHTEHRMWCIVLVGICPFLTNSQDTTTMDITFTRP